MKKDENQSEKSSSADTVDSSQSCPATQQLPVTTGLPSIVERRLLTRGMGRRPNPGWAWNPLRTLPPNSLCPCRSEKKFKRCCLKRLPELVPVDVAKQHLEQMAKPDLVFLTPENQHQIMEDVQRNAECDTAAEPVH